MKVNGNQKFVVTVFFQNIVLFGKKKESHRFGELWGQVTL